MHCLIACCNCTIHSLSFSVLENVQHRFATVASLSFLEHKNDFVHVTNQTQSCIFLCWLQWWSEECLKISFCSHVQLATVVDYVLLNSVTPCNIQGALKYMVQPSWMQFFSRTNKSIICNKSVFPTSFCFRGNNQWFTMWHLSGSQDYNCYRNSNLERE